MKSDSVETVPTNLVATALLSARCTERATITLGVTDDSAVTPTVIVVIVLL